MSGPGFRVATDHLRTEATLWRDEAGTLLDIQNKADGQRFEGVEGGLYAPIFMPAYHAVVDMVVTRCGEGQHRMLEIEAALRQVARSYEEEEARIQIRLQSAASATSGAAGAAGQP